MDMINYDKDNISEGVSLKVNQMLDSPSFSLSDVAAASTELVSIMKWIMALMTYHKSLKMENKDASDV